MPPKPLEEASRHYPIAIIGAGALGLTFAARLAEVGPVAVIARTEMRALALRSGITVGSQSIRVAAFTAADAPRADYAIILVKAGETEAAARTALAMRPKAVLSLQNGLIEERLRKVLGQIPCGQGVTTAGAWRDGERVIPAGLGETLVPPGFEAVAEQLSRAGLPARVEREIYAARLSKLLVNLAINPVTALFRVPNGALADPPYRVFVEALVREAWPVLRAEGLALDEDAAKKRVFEVIAGTAENRSSMLQDVLAGRPTEIDALTVAFLSLAARHLADVPSHAALCHLLRLSEASGLGIAASQR